MVPRGSRCPPRDLSTLAGTLGSSRMRPYHMPCVGHVWPRRLDLSTAIGSIQGLYGSSRANMAAPEAVWTDGEGPARAWTCLKSRVPDAHQISGIPSPSLFSPHAMRCPRGRGSSDASADPPRGSNACSPAHFSVDNPVSDGITSVMSDHHRVRRTMHGCRRGSISVYKSALAASLLSSSRSRNFSLASSPLSSHSHSITMRFSAVAAAVFGLASFAVAAPLEKRASGTATWYTQNGNAGSASLPCPSSH